MTMGRGSRPGTWRTVSRGSSACTVPAPTATASTQERQRWTWRRARSPEIQRASPVRAAMRPSRVCASLSRDQGQVLGAVFDVSRVEALRLFSAKPDVNGDALFAQRGDSPSRHALVGIFHRAVEPFNASANHGLSTGRSATVERAGLQRDIEIGPLRRVAGPAQGVDLGVRSADLQVGPFADDAVLAHHHRADHGIGADLAAPSLC